LDQLPEVPELPELLEPELPELPLPMFGHGWLEDGVVVEGLVVDGAVVDGLEVEPEDELDDVPDEELAVVLAAGWLVDVAVAADDAARLTPSPIPSPAQPSATASSGRFKLNAMQYLLVVGRPFLSEGRPPAVHHLDICAGCDPVRRS